MASINQSKNGLKAIQFYNADGERKTIRIGKTTMRDAEKIKTKIEELNVAKINGTPLEVETASWLSTRPAKFYEKLVKAGLAETRIEIEETPAVLLEAFIDNYIHKRGDVKPETVKVYQRCKKHLVEFFGADRVLTQMTPGDATDWRRWLEIKQKLSKNTIGRTCGIAKQFFHDAAEREFITRNPFAKLPTQVKGNEERQYFISREDAQAVLDACPDAQWRLLFALSRFGGLRCPSEHLALRWSDVDWKRSRITIRSSKTEHHDDQGVRVIPIFPELRSYLEDVRDLANPDEEFVITRYRQRNANLRTQLERIIKKAGLKPWPKLFQNLRSTRETELAEQFPIHVVCKWIGNSEIIARKHYLQVTDADYAKASGALLNALRYNAPSASTESYCVTRESANLGKSQKRRHRLKGKMGGTGLEPVTLWV